MKGQIDRQELLSAARKAAVVTPHASALEILNGVLLETDTDKGLLTLTATNLEISLRQSLPLRECEGENVSAVIDAKLLTAMLTQLSGDTVQLKQEETAQMVFSGGDAIYRIPVRSGRDFPVMSFPTAETTVKVSGIPAMVHRTAFATLNSETTPLLQCVNVKLTHEGLKAVSSDGSCAIAARGNKQSTGEASLLVPAVALEKLARLCGDKDTFDMEINAKSIVFRKENFAYSTRLMAGSYVNTDQIFGSLKNGFSVLSDAAELYRAMESVSALTTDDRVTLTFADNTLDLSCGGNSGKSKMSVNVIPLSGSPNGAYCFSLNRLEKALRVMGGTVTVGIAQSNVLTLSTEDAQYMQTALREKTATKKRAKAA